jgi:serine/threonine-protein kinase RsbT
MVWLSWTSTDSGASKVDDETRVLIRQDSDIISARQQGRALAAQLGFSSIDQTLIATAISEVARNILLYAQRGEIILRLVHRSAKQGILVIARDEGPGIPDITLALQDGYSTSNSLGLGLPGAKRLMDEFAIVSEVGKGTTITMKKWKP